jgi:predicted metal-binding protein
LLDDECPSEEIRTLAMPIALFVCRSCRPEGWKPEGPRPGSLLVGEVERVVRAQGLTDKVAVLPIHCLAHCAHACSAAILPQDGPRVVFDELAPTAEVAEALVTLTMLVRREGRSAAMPERCPAVLASHRRER